MTMPLISTFYSVPVKQIDTRNTVIPGLTRNLVMHRWIPGQARNDAPKEVPLADGLIHAFTDD